jgi:hypothetical protein
MRCAHGARDFLQWFRTFIGKDTYADIDCDELRDLLASLKELKLSPA